MNSGRTEKSNSGTKSKLQLLTDLLPSSLKRVGNRRQREMAIEELHLKSKTEQTQSDAYLKRCNSQLCVYIIHSTKLSRSTSSRNNLSV